MLSYAKSATARPVGFENGKLNCLTLGQLENEPISKKSGELASMFLVTRSSKTMLPEITPEFSTHIAMSGNEAYLTHISWCFSEQSYK